MRKHSIKIGDDHLQANLSNLLIFSITLLSSLLAMNVHLGVGIVVAVILSLLFSLFNKQKKSGYFLPHILLLPLFLLTLGNFSSSDPSNNYSMAQGKLVITLWSAAILYLLLAIIYRSLSKKTRKKVLPDYYVGGLLILFSLLIMIGLLGKIVVAEKSGYLAINYTATLSLVMMLIVYFLLKQAGPFKARSRFALPLAFLVGLLTYVIFDVITLIQHDNLAQTIYLSQFKNISSMPYFTFSGFKTHFNFYNYVSFDINQLQFVAPLVLTIFLNDTRIEAPQSEQQNFLLGTRSLPELDYRVLSNSGATLLGSSLGSGSYHLKKVSQDSQSKQNQIFNSMMLLLMIILVFALPIESLLLTVPSGVYYGILIILLTEPLFKGYGLIKRSLPEEGKSKTITGSLLVIVPGLVLGIIYLVETYLGYAILSLNIGNVRVNLVLVVVLLGLLFNLIWPSQTSGIAEKNGTE